MVFVYLRKKIQLLDFFHLCPLQIEFKSNGELGIGTWKLCSATLIIYCYSYTIFTKLYHYYWYVSDDHKPV